VFVRKEDNNEAIICSPFQSWARASPRAHCEGFV